MKKLLVLITLLLISCVGCGNSNEGSETMLKVQEYYQNVESLNLTAQINTSIYDKTGEFLIDFEYDTYSDDTVIIVEPDSIKGLSVQITKFNDEIKMNFDDVQLETLLAENKGINPCDVLTFAINDLKNSVPKILSLGEQIKITYENQEISKQIFLNAENYDIMSVECFVNGEMVLYLTIS